MADFVTAEELRWLLINLHAFGIGGICYNAKCADPRPVPHLTCGHQHPIPSKEADRG